MCQESTQTVEHEPSFLFSARSITPSCCAASTCHVYSSLRKLRAAALMNAVDSYSDSGGVTHGRISVPEPRQLPVSSEIL